MVTFSLSISPIVYVCIALNLLAFIYIATFFRSFVLKVKKHKNDYANVSDEAPNVPALSIIVYCKDNAERLAKLLPQILNQKYAAPFEVIIVNDGGSEDTKDVFNYLCLSHSNLYQTFIPKEANNISPKKLAINLGVKAARYDYILFTNADAVINSDLWLQQYGIRFAKGKEVVFGNTVPTPDCKKILSRTKRFDILSDRIETLSSALSGKIYRCSTYNMGYKKSLFFDSKGFSREVNKYYGDDDIFIRIFANNENTAVLLSNEALVECDYLNPLKSHSIGKQRNIYTSHLTTPYGRRILSLGSFSSWLWLATAVAGILLSLPNLVPAIVFTTITIPFWWVIIYSLIKASKALSTPVSGWLIPFHILHKPIYDALYKIKTHKNRRQFYVLR